MASSFITDIARGVARELVSLVAVSPLVIAGLQNSSARNRWNLIGFSVAVIFVTDFATASTGSLFGIQQPEWLHWNWIGKLACILTVGFVAGIMPTDLCWKSGLLTLPCKGSALSIFGFLFYCALLGCLTAYDPGLTVDKETLAYQLLMPGLAEEPVYRAVLPALLGTALGSPWVIAGARLGWWWLAISAYFGLGHAIGWSSQGELEFHCLPFLIITALDLPYGWIAARCGSVWPCVVGHGLNNASYVAIALIFK